MPPTGPDGRPRFHSSIVSLQEYAERCGLAEPSPLSFAERMKLAYGIDLATAQAPKCLLCEGSGIVARGRVSGMYYEIACDCPRGRRNSLLCRIVNPRPRKHRRPGRRRAYLGGVNRNSWREIRLVPIEEVWAGMEC